MFAKQKIVLIFFVSLLLGACAPAPGPSTLQNPTASVEGNPTAEPQTIDQIMDSCPTAEEIATINSSTQIIFKADPTAPNLVCRADGGSANLTLLQKNVYNTFRVMRQLEFDLPLPWTELGLFDWFAQAANGLVFDPEAEFSRCCDDEGRILVQTKFLLAAQTDLWIDSYHGGVGVNSLLPMLVHEARHAEGYPHDCTTNLGGDRSLKQMGAWAVEYYFDLWITDHSSAGFFTDYYREISHANAGLILHTRFCPGETLNP